MTNSDQLRQHAERVVAALRSELDERCVAVRVDEPIDRAVAAFRFDRRGPFNTQRFHSLLEAFVAHLYAHGVVPARQLAPAQAAAEAIELLERGYQGTHEGGYDGAVLDAAAAAGSGIDTVLARLAEIIKGRRRHIYRQWVLAKHVDPHDWPLRCAIAALLLQSRRAEDGTAQIAGRPEQFADHIPELLESELSTEAMLDQLVAAALRSSP